MTKKTLMTKKAIKLSRSSEHGSGPAGNTSTHENQPAVDPQIEAALGQDLRSVFSDVLNEPVPQRFIDLLDDLLKKAEA